MADVSLIYNILGRDRVSDVLSRVKREAASANDENLKGFRQLEQQIAKVRGEAKKLAEEFARTGDADAKRDWQRVERQAKQLERLRDQLAKSLGGGGSDGKGGLWSQMLGQLPSIAPMTHWLIAGAAAAAPAVGAAVSAGVLLGVGGGALAAGIIAAAQDSRVQNAYKDLGSFVVQTFRTASQPLVGPLVDGAAKFSAAWSRYVPAIRSSMARLEPVINSLVDGVIGFVDKIGPGLGKAFNASLPLLKQVGAELPRLGSAASDFFESIARGGPGAQQFFHDLVTAIGGTLRAVGLLTEGLSKVYQLNAPWYRVLMGDIDGAKQSMLELMYGTEATTSAVEVGRSAWDAVSRALDGTNGELKRTNELQRQVSFAAISAGLGARVSSQDFQVLSGAISATATTSDVLAGQMTSRLIGTMLSVSSSTLGVKSAQLDLKDAFSQNGLAIDKTTGLISMNTRAGIGNREAVLRAVESNLRFYEAQINSGVGADVAAQKYGANTEALKAQMRQAGLTDAQIEDLIGDYGRVPGKVNTAIAMQGLTDAINGLSNLLRQINGIPTYKRVTIDQVTVARRIDAGGVVPGTGGMRINRWGGVWQHAAVGALRDAQVYSAVSSGARYAFAEPQTGGEAFIPRRGDYGRSMGILQHAASWYDAAVVPQAAVPAYAVPSAAGGQASAPAALGGSGKGTGAGIHIENLEVKAYSDRFSLSQVQGELYMHGVH